MHETAERIGAAVERGAQSIGESTKVIVSMAVISVILMVAGIALLMASRTR